MSDIAISVENVSKRFSRSLKRTMLYGTADLASSFFGVKQDTAKLRKGEFWALDNVSFQVKKGEAVGLVGGNGAGKSTMLKLINGIFMPDKGRIAINGRIGALIEVGAGFHPMLTGRENIYVNGSILGLTKAEIDRQLESIIEFAEIEDFIDAPVKHYSSGMYVRLGFAIAAHCRPDILLIDEVLAVGDAKFQRKCLNYLVDLRKQGVTFIIVSHNMQNIEGITSSGILFEKGKMLMCGDSRDIIVRHELNMFANYSESEDEAESLQLVKRHSGFGTNDIEIQSFRLIDSSGQAKKLFGSNEELTVEISLKVPKVLNNVKLWLAFVNEQNVSCLGTRQEFNLPSGEQILRFKFNPLQLTTGKYRIAFNVFDITCSNPYCHGHYGYFCVSTNLPVVNPGYHSPYCWTSPVIEIVRQ